MSTQMTLTTTTQPTAATLPTVAMGLNQDQRLGLEALSIIESKNNQILTEVLKSQEITNESLATLRKNLEASIQENLTLKNQILQLETTNRENIQLHTAEIKKNTQIITALSESINPLREDLRLATNRVTTLENQMKILTTPPPQPVAPTPKEIWAAMGINCDGNIFK